MSKITGNEPAMPIVNSDGYCVWLSSINSQPDHIEATGLTIRQQFAAMAMQGLMAVPSKGEGTWEETAKIAANISVMVADALINELNKSQP